MIIRVRHNENYFIMNKTGVNDKRLSYKAVGLLAYLLSKPDNWTVNIKHLSKQHKDGKASVESGLKELEKYNYLHRYKKRNKKGQYEWESVVTEIPTKSPQPDFPDMDNPDMEKPELDNQALINNEVISNDLINNELNKSIDIQKLDNGQYQYPDEFEQLWQHYPNKKGKKAAFKKWKATLNKGADNQSLIKAAKNYAEVCEGREKRYIMHGRTFFGPDEHWRDYLKTEEEEQREKQFAEVEKFLKQVGD